MDGREVLNVKWRSPDEQESMLRHGWSRNLLTMYYQHQPSISIL